MSYIGFGGVKSDSQNVASKQQSITSAYEKLHTEAEVCDALLSLNV